MPHNYALTNNPFECLPRDVMAQIFRFVQDYELLGLGKVCHEFRRMLRASGLYDPFVLDTPSTRWNDLGYSNPQVDNPSAEALATLAYAKIKETLTEEVAEENLRKGMTLEVQTRTKTLTTLSQTLNLHTTNCLAQLKLGDRSLIAVNFIKNEQNLKALWQAKQNLRSASVSHYHKVENRHAEMRLIMRLTEPTQEANAELIIDKLCCVFCAAQIYALGFKKLITGWKAGQLNWYNFSPSVMFFPRRRVKMWGEEVESKFRMLPPQFKVAFLYSLARKAAQPEVMEVLYLDVPFEQNKNVKELGAYFDGKHRLWYVRRNPDPEKMKQWQPWRQDADPEKIKKWRQDAKRKYVSPQSEPEAKKRKLTYDKWKIPAADRLYLDVHIDEKNQVKALGASYDGTLRKWYIHREDLEMREKTKKWQKGRKG